MGRIWSQSIARRTLFGDDSQNPSIAAKAALGQVLGRRLVARGTRRARRTRRRFHRGNPAPAFLASLAGFDVGNIPLVGGLFKKRSDVIASGLAPAIVAAANSGNLTAARGLMERAVWPMNPKEHMVWALAEKQLSAKVRAAVKKYADMIPQASQRNPKEFAASLTPGVSLSEIEAQAAADIAEAKAERAATAAASRAERQALLGTVADVGVAGLQAFAGRGRQPARRRKKRRTRRSSARRISF